MNEEQYGVVEGQGLGLLNSKVLAEGHEGSISLTSVVGEYTEVVFTIGASEAPMPPMPLLQPG